MVRKIQILFFFFKHAVFTNRHIYFSFFLMFKSEKIFSILISSLIKFKVGLIYKLIYLDPN